MRTTLLASALASAALVQAAPKVHTSSTSSACVCTESSTRTTTVYAKTVTAKVTTHISTTVPGETVTSKVTASVEDDVTRTVTLPTTVTTTAAAGVTDSPNVLARDLFAANKKQCSCASTTTIVKVATAKATATKTSTVTQTKQIALPNTTVTSAIHTKTLVSTVSTETDYSTFYDVLYPSSSTSVLFTSSSVMPLLTSSSVMPTSSFTPVLSEASSTAVSNPTSTPAGNAGSAPRTSPSGSNSSSTCGTSTTAFLVQVLGDPSSYLSVDEYGDTTIANLSSASTFALDPSTSALTIPSDANDYYTPGVTVYSSASTIGYYKDGISFQDLADAQASGLLTWALNGDCSFAVQDAQGWTTFESDANGDLYLVEPAKVDYYEEDAGMFNVTLVAVPLSS